LSPVHADLNRRRDAVRIGFDDAIPGREAQALRIKTRTGFIHASTFRVEPTK